MSSVEDEPLFLSRNPIVDGYLKSERLSIPIKSFSNMNYELSVVVIFAATQYPEFIYTFTTVSYKNEMDRHNR